MAENKILVTGGAGFIGSNLVEKLYDNNYQIVVMDNLSEQIHGFDIESSFTFKKIKNKVEFLRGDVRNVEDWIKALENIDIVIHLAAETGTGQSMYNSQNYTNVNCQGTAILCDILMSNNHSIKKVILASSRSIYGEGKYSTNDGEIVYPKERESSLLDKGIFEFKHNGKALKALPTDENSQINPISTYALTKYYQEELLKITCESKNISFTALRFQNVYGPGQSLSNPYTGIISIFSNRLKENKELFIFEDGNESRDFVYIDDVCNSIFLAINYNVRDLLRLNVGSGIQTTVLDLSKKLKFLMNSSSKITVTGQFRKGDIRHNFADLKNIRNTLGFEPLVNIDEGLKRFVNWSTHQDVRIDKYEESLIELKDKGLLS